MLAGLFLKHKYGLQFQPINLTSINAEVCHDKLQTTTM